jgi:hypothetical protein
MLLAAFLPFLRCSGSLCHFCIPGPYNVSSHPFVLSGFLFQYHPCFVSYAHVPYAVTLLHGGSSSFWRQPIPSAVQNFPGSEFS